MRQFKSLEIPFEILEFKACETKQDYFNQMSYFLQSKLKEDFSSLLSGDIYLEDLRETKDECLKPLSIKKFILCGEKIRRACS